MNTPTKKLKNGDIDSDMAVADNYLEYGIPLLAASREEERFHFELIDSVFDKLMDVCKILFSLSLPALIAVLSLDEHRVHDKKFLINSLVLMIVGSILVFVVVFKIRSRFAKYYRLGAVKRSEVIDELMEYLKHKVKYMESTKSLETLKRASKNKEVLTNKNSIK